MSFNPSTQLACSVEIYPLENSGGTPYTIQGGQILSVTVSKSLLGGSVGQFSIELANGGPQGPEDPITWSQIITPMSHVLIAMSRGGDNAAIVMDGIVNNPSESQTWKTTNQNATASRSQLITGSDFAWFFKRFNYYALTFQGLTAGIPGFANGLIPQSLANILQQGFIGGTDSSNSNPVQVAMLWYNKVMAGSQGILSQTNIPFTGGSNYTFPNVVATTFEPYPNVYIPYADFFMVGEESWMQKFLGIFPHPWYEFFVTTAPQGVYNPTTGINTAGTTFTMQSMPYAPPAGPVLVARVNPTPAFAITASSGSDTAAISNLDLSRWNNLPLFDFTQSSYGFFSSNISFSSDSARNFYQLNPTYYKTLLNQNNANNIPVPFYFIAAGDPASIQRYGFAPQIAETRWMCDPQGSAAIAGLNIENTIFELTGRLISWFHPQPLMARAQVTLPLTPQLLIGTRFRYAPFKNGEPWDFYIEAVQHRFVFGGNSMTTLTLGRGLPAGVYQDTSLLQSIHVGNASRTNGVYQTGLPAGSAASLTVVDTQQQAATLAGQMSKVFVTPQGLGS